MFFLIVLVVVFVVYFDTMITQEFWYVKLEIILDAFVLICDLYGDGWGEISSTASSSQTL